MIAYMKFVGKSTIKYACVQIVPVSGQKLVNSIELLIYFELTLGGNGTMVVGLFYSGMNAKPGRHNMQLTCLIH
jgi:hypothetical protein